MATAKEIIVTLDSDSSLTELHLEITRLNTQALKQSIEFEKLKDQAFKQRSHAIQMYNDMKHLVESMRDDAVGKMVLKARLNNYAHAFNIEK